MYTCMYTASGMAHVSLRNPWDVERRAHVSNVSSNQRSPTSMIAEREIRMDFSCRHYQCAGDRPSIRPTAMPEAEVCKSDNSML